MPPQEVISYLESFINHELSLDRVSPSDFKIDRLKYFLKLIGHPEQPLKTIHIAGTKGKGSVAAMTANILAHAGYRVGLFTSPHICDFRERIRCISKNDGVSEAGDIFTGMISYHDLEELVNELRPFVDQLHKEQRWGHLTYFELTTALAIYYFKKKKVDFVVLETGLGGRLDATNACPSIISVITPISFDHMNLLGNTIPAIASEKAAIIKSPDQKVVVSPQSFEAQQVIEERCRLIRAGYYSVAERIQLRLLRRNTLHQAFELKIREGVCLEIELPLHGDHQLVNAATVAGIVDNLRQLGYKIPVEAVREGFRTVFWPGRFECLQDSPRLIIDGAHNPASIQALVATFKNIYSDKKVVLIFGAAKDKDVGEMVKALRSLPIAKVVLTAFDHPRSCVWKKEEVMQFFFENEVEVISDVRSALAAARRGITTDSVILATGSIFLISEVREICVRSKH